MRSFLWSFLILFGSIFNAFSTTKSIEKKSYFPTNKEHQLHLNLLGFTFENKISDSTKFDFKFKIEKDLKTAIAITKKAKEKYLVVYSDLQNTAAKADFDIFIKNLEEQINEEKKEGYITKYTALNYYLATGQDQKWLTENKIENTPTIIVLNGDGVVLAIAKSALKDKKNKLTNYSFCLDIERIDAKYNFKKVTKEKAVTDASLIAAFYKGAVIDVLLSETPPEEESEVSPTDFKFMNVVLDEKEVSQMWEKLIKAHQKDTKANVLLVETILREMTGFGFYTQFLSKTRAIDATDFTSIDYLIKHYDAVEKLKKTLNTDLIEKYANLDKEILDFLKPSWGPRIDEIDRIENNDRVVGVYKKLIASGHQQLDIYEGYTNYLIRKSQMTNNDIMYLKEFSAFFNENLSTGKGNADVKAEAVYKKYSIQSEHNKKGLDSFKEYQAEACNAVAWSVVEKPVGASFLKAAIKWSEFSLDLSKNNASFLDTLAQLYYKDGQKEKAIKTQTLAVSNLEANVSSTTAVSIRETLNKMQNGTY